MKVKELVALLNLEDPESEVLANDQYIGVVTQIVKGYWRINDGFSYLAATKYEKPSVLLRTKAEERL
jgi:hypothetical protein